jgi:hypothetical protein
MSPVTTSSIQALSSTALPLLNSLFKCWIHQWINPFIWAELSWSNCHWKYSHKHTLRYALLIS